MKITITDSAGKELLKRLTALRWARHSNSKSQDGANVTLRVLSREVEKAEMDILQHVLARRELRAADVLEAFVL